MVVVVVVVVVVVWSWSWSANAVVLVAVLRLAPAWVIASSPDRDGNRIVMICLGIVMTCFVSTRLH